MDVGATTASAGTRSTAASHGTMTGDDFMMLLITQLQNQDPLEPMSNEEMLSQIATIEQMQSSSQLSDVLSKLADQQQFAGASDLVGHYVAAERVGIDGQPESVTGLVTAVHFTSGGDVMVELDNGSVIPIASVKQIRPDPFATTGVALDTRDPDVNGDGAVDEEDLRAVVQGYTGPNVPAADVDFAKDVDRDGDIDVDDALIVAEEMKQQAAASAFDVDGNSIVDDDDLSMLMAAYTGAGQAAGETPADLDGDGDVDVDDATALLNRLNEILAGK
jgi:flagellar hook assembly protein FlgD